MIYKSCFVLWNQLISHIQDFEILVQVYQVFCLLVFFHITVIEISLIQDVPYYITEYSFKSLEHIPTPKAAFSKSSYYFWCYQNNGNFFIGITTVAFPILPYLNIWDQSFINFCFPLFLFISITDLLSVLSINLSKSIGLYLL